MRNRFKLTSRIWIVFCLFGIGFFSLMIKLYQIQIRDHQKYTQLSKQQTEKTILVTPRRGDIFDRNGIVLATTQKVYSLYANGKEISFPEDVARQLVPLIEKSSFKTLYALLTQDRYFIWIKRKLSMEVKDSIQSLQIKGLYFLPETKRVYPQQTLASTILGFVGLDNEGLNGIEYTWDKLLRGSEGKMMIETDPLGRLIFSHQQKIEPAIDGQDIMLSIDETLQYIAETEIEQGVIACNAARGTVIIMDVHSGAILAMANFPQFDPNQFFRYPAATLRNNAITSVYEPGSTLKPITLAIALQQGVITSTSSIYCPDSIMVGNHIIRESHTEEHSQPYKSITQILADSLNVGTAKIGMLMSRTAFYQGLVSFGLGQKTGIELSGESTGLLHAARQWTEADRGRIPFGQGIAVTPLQLVAACNVIANDGNFVAPNILIKHKKILPIQQRPVVSPAVAHSVLAMMEVVVTKGTGGNAQIPGYRVAGKTGTAQKVKEYGIGYEPGAYVASFLGILPVSSPQLTILVILDTPKKDYYGAQVAAPVFRNIAIKSLRYLTIAPDNLLTIVSSPNIGYHNLQ